MRSNSYKIIQAFPGFHVMINPALKGDFVNGRARGGLFIAVPEVLKNNVFDVFPLS